MQSTTTPEALGRNLNREWFNTFIRKYAIVIHFHGNVCGDVASL